MLFFIVVKLIKVDLATFWKICRGVPFIILHLKSRLCAVEIMSTSIDCLEWAYSRIELKIAFYALQFTDLLALFVEYKQKLCFIWFCCRSYVLSVWFRMNNLMHLTYGYSCVICDRSVWTTTPFFMNELWNTWEDRICTWGFYLRRYSVLLIGGIMS